LSNYSAGILDAGKARARRISAWICNERATPPAAKRPSQNAQVIFSRVLTQWQALEVKNAIRLKAFRKEITAVEMNQSIAAFEQDIATGRWRRPVNAAATVEQKAGELSASHSAILGCRTLDIIHVAAAVVIGAREFITFDARQGAMAKQAGLTVKP
jgi:hypothetical protein